MEKKKKGKSEAVEGKVVEFGFGDDELEEFEGKNTAEK